MILSAAIMFKSGVKKKEYLLKKIVEKSLEKK